LLNRNLDAQQISARQASDTSRSFLVELLEIVVLALVLYVVIQFAVETVRVIGVSMSPTLGDEDYLIASRLDYRFHHPGRGDIIIMRDPFDSTKDFIKRVVALPGENLRIRDGQVYINDRLLTEPYLPQNESWTVAANWPTDPAQSDTIPQNEYFVMGDNRNHSTDSRTFGAVRSDQIEAHAWVRIWPLDHLGIVDKSARFAG
jgi:signal peptidase I